MLILNAATFIEASIYRNSELNDFGVFIVHLVTQGLICFSCF
ncbi:uncharacterized protein METZ01_LOCUS267046 [marine metagenome]|uniref:Uncharacterized protein n=1 Tax=marine metagenome TaxID=408172 RepID=A0A382JS79_9ZZZZ